MTLQGNKKNDNFDQCNEPDKQKEIMKNKNRIFLMNKTQERKLNRILAIQVSPISYNTFTIQKLNTFIPEVGRYNPNYRSIEKKTPSAIIFSYSDQKEKNKKLSNTSIPVKEMIMKTIPTKHMKSQIESSFSRKNIIDDSLLIKSKMNTKQLSLTTNYPKLIPQPNNGISLEKRKKYDSSIRKVLIHSVSFKTMRGREMTLKSDIHKNNTPTLGTYNPQYGCIDKHKTIISFNGKINQSDHNKKWLINKVIRSYNLKNDYKVMKLLHKAKTEHHSSNSTKVEMY